MEIYNIICESEPSKTIDSNKINYLTLQTEDEEEKYRNLTKAISDMFLDESLETLQKKIQTLFECSMTIDGALQNQKLTDLLAKKISYPSWSLFLLRLYKSMDNFNEEITLPLKKELILTYFQKSDKNFRIIYDKFREIKNDKTKSAKVEQYLLIGRKRFSIDKNKAIGIFMDLKNVNKK